jgi:hypothetical protein
MAKIIRAKQRIFGDSVVANYNHAVFGSLKAAAPAYSKDPDTIQSTAWDEGWKAATVNNQAPALQDLNALDYLLSRQIAYILQAGVPEYDATTTHYIDDICRSGGSLHRSLVDDNTGNAVTDTSKWGGVFGINPLGSIIAMGNVAAWALPTADEVKDGYALCNGNTFAALGAGNFNSAFIGSRPTLNDSRFLMGSTAVGSTGGANSQASNVTIADHTALSLNAEAGHTHEAGTLNTLLYFTGTTFYASQKAVTSWTSTVGGNIGVSSLAVGQFNGVDVEGTTAAGSSHNHTFAQNITAHSVTNNAVENRPLYFSVVYLMRVK